MEYTNQLADNIHRLILKIDSELIICADLGIREKLVKTIYELRDLENLLLSKQVNESVFTRIQALLTSV